jgi:hypothetical protein
MYETKAVEVSKDCPVDLLPGEFMFINGNMEMMYFHLPESKNHTNKNVLLIGSIDDSWQIVRNPDNTITVSPSIRMSDENGECWHGFLRNNVWEEI